MRLNRRRLRAFVRQLPAHLRRPAVQPSDRRPVMLATAVVAAELISLTLIWAVAKPTAKAPMPSPTVVTESTDKPAEDRPDPAKYRWTGQASMPKYLKLPSIQTEGFIQQVSVDQHKAVAVPSNIHMAGWFVQSQLPGAQGLSIISGHLDGRSGGGIFEHLGKLKTGDKFTIGFGNNSTKTFVTRKVASMPVAETASVLFSQDPGIKNQLNLITCGGTYDTSKQQYDERVVVIAELLL